MLEELYCEPFVDLVGFSQFESDPHQVQTEESHPAGGIGLLKDRAARELVTAIDHCDVVKTEEAALEDVVPFSINFVDPPGKVDQQLVKDLLKKLCVGDSVARAIQVVDTPTGPGVHRRV